MYVEGNHWHSSLSIEVSNLQKTEFSLSTKLVPPVKNPFLCIFNVIACKMYSEADFSWSYDFSEVEYSEVKLFMTEDY